MWRRRGSVIDEPLKHEDAKVVGGKVAFKRVGFPAPQEFYAENSIHGPAHS